MPNEKGLSKRQQLREKRQREQIRSRLFSIGAVVIGALLLSLFFIVPNLVPVEVVSITPGAYPQTDMNTMGDPDAPVKLETWEDFQCPACKNFSENVESLLIQNYVATGKVYYIFHHYPFIDDYSNTSNESDQAANASMCAGEQGRFWDYKDILFANWNGENIGAYSDRKLVAFAESLGLDMGEFSSCFNSNAYKSQIDKDFADGLDIGVASTPSVFVNGVFVVNPNGANLVPGYEDIAAMIEAALAEMGQ